MSSPSRFDPTIADVVTLSVLLDRDEQQTRKEVQMRDRLIGEHLPLSITRTETTLRWLGSVCAEDAQLRSVRNNVETTTHWTGVIIAAIGLLFGWSAALGVFYFDGSGRVNAIGVLAVFVLLPGLLLLPFMAVALPARFLSWLPGANAAIALARGLSPGRLSILIMRFFPAEVREAWRQLSGRVGAHHRLFLNLQKWAMLRWSQSFALGFQVAALTSTLYLVVFTDLAFGWSTTLTSGHPNEDAQTIHGIASAIALPWASSLPEAVPSLELITESRYFRVAADRLTHDEAARLGGWWTFIVMTMLLYGLSPRIISFLVAGNRLGAATRHAFLSTPGLSTVLNRIRQAHVQTASDEPEAQSVQNSAETGGGIEVPVRAPVGVVINWSAVPATDAAIRAAFGQAPIHPAGANVSIEEDHRLADQLAPVIGDEQAVAILVKAWEPPLMEFIDFVRLLRPALGDGRSIIVLPVGIDTGSRLHPAEDRQLEIWRRKISQVGDPWLRVDLIQEVAGI
ncbi:MAG: hypothetical protein DRP71_07555 [Verrucomicrobia bacterium]|nr:MAG: hypothetical protein DRP71_07555 [Verrucomicrobiota bacterium]